MREPHEFPIEDIAEYWQLVRGVLVAGGMSKKEAAEVAKAYREYMKPAGWAFYNRDPEDAAAYAIKYAAWMRKKADKAAPKMTKIRSRPLTNFGGVIDDRWLRSTNKLALELGRPPTSVEIGKLLGLSKAEVGKILPIEGDIATLPRWAIVALAARSVRRVLSLCDTLQPHVEMQYSLSVNDAVKRTESAAASGRMTEYTSDAAKAAQAVYFKDKFVSPLAYIADAADAALYCAKNAQARDVEAALRSANRAAEAYDISASFRQEYEHLRAISRLHQWTADTPVPPAVFGPMWPEGPPAGWPALPKQAKLRLTVEVPDALDDASVRVKLQTLTAALARLNVAGGGHGLKLLPPIDFTQEQDKGRADVVREEGEKPNSRGNARRGR